MQVKATMNEIFAINKANGFWDEKRNFGEMLMLITSELSEALEADRHGQKAPLNWVEIISCIEEPEKKNEFFKSHVKDSVGDELADAVIRLFDVCEGLDIPLEAHIRHKLNYNNTRGYRHGKAY